MAQLSQQLRRFLDDKAWLENRRIMDILRSIETRALALRDAKLTGEIMTLADTAAEVELPMERPLHKPAVKPTIADNLLASGAEDDDIDARALYAQVVLDKTQLTRHIRQSLQARSQITLKELIDDKPLTQGLAELVAYLELGSETFKTTVDETTAEHITWVGQNRDNQPTPRRARLPRVIFVR